MITVVEGPSAVGKTTLLCSLPSSQVISEDWAALGFPAKQRPDIHTPEELAFGISMVAHRWKLLCEVEHHYGNAYADTDPLKLYYDFALTLRGVLSREQLLATFHASRQAMVAQQLGFADVVVFLRASSATLWSRKQRDTSRRRRNFELHVQLIDAFALYYTMLERIRPGTVVMYDTEQHDASSTLLAQYARHGQRYLRYDIEAFDALQQRLLNYVDASSL